MKKIVCGLVLAGICAVSAAPQADIDAGTDIVNTVTATGNPPTGEAVTDTATETVSVEAAEASIDVTKVADKKSGLKAGQTVTYTITVTNDGNVTLTDVAISDALAGVTVGTLSATTLAPGATATATATYEVTQADKNARAHI